MITRKSCIYKNFIIIADALIVTFAYLFAFWFRLLSGIFPRAWDADFTILHVITLIGIVLFQVYLFNKNELYEENTFLRRINQIPIIINASLISIIFLLFISFITKDNPFLERRGVILIAVFLQIILMVFSRIFIFRNLFHLLLKKGIGKEKIIIIGPDETANRLKNALMDFDRFRFDIKKIINEKEFSLKKLKTLCHKHNIDNVFVIQEKLNKDKILNIVAYCKNSNKHIFLLSNMFDIAISKVDVSTFEGIPVIDLSLPGGFHFHLLMKRLFDIFGSLILIILLSPLFVLIAVMIKFDSKGPVIFAQERIGKDGKKFKMYKFRTMFIDADDSIHKDYVKKLIKEGVKDKSGVYKLEDDPRITKVGKFLRKYSLDELPQLENVLMGSMSLVGPRPPLEYEVENYSEWHKRRLSVRPGMTGLWQVSGRNSIGFEDMVLLDIYYAENWTIWMDIQILIRTIPVVLFKKDGR